jgi:hypothetical protein
MYDRSDRDIYLVSFFYASRLDIEIEDVTVIYLIRTTLDSRLKGQARLLEIYADGSARLLD